MKKTAVITGVNSGIGVAIANILLAEGWQIGGLSRRNPQIKGVAHRAIDLNDIPATTKLAGALASKLTRVDAFIHVAGVWHNETHALADTPFEQFTPSQITEAMNVGLTSAMILCGKLLPLMDEKSVVIGVSGTFAEGAAGWLPYYTSKRGLEDFLTGLAQDKAGLRVYGISPADTATPAYAKFYPDYLADAQPADAVGLLALRLIQDETDFVSGDIIQLRGGETTPGYHR